MIHTSLISSIVILLWRMIGFIPTSRVLSPPAVPKYNMQSAYTLSVLEWGWEASGLRRCLPSNDPCSTSVTFSNNPQRSLVSSSNFCPPDEGLNRAYRECLHGCEQCKANRRWSTGGALSDPRGQVSRKNGSHPPAAGMLFPKNSRPLSMLLWFISF